jgi:putative methionine-R-sulfoxide reductase with GAF domain
MIERLKEVFEKLQEWAKDPAKLSFGLSVVFFVSILISGYLLATLRHDLVFQGGMTSYKSEGWVIARLILFVVGTFLLGIAALYINQKVKKETIVFVEKKEDESETSERIAGDEENTLDLKKFQESLSKVKEIKSRKQEGLNILSNFLEAGQAAFYEWNGHEATFTFGFAFAPELEVPTYTLGEGLVGQAATGKSIYLDELPEDYFNVIESGLGSARPRSLFVIPLSKEGKVIGVIEFAALKLLSESTRKKVIEAGNILADNC